MKISKPAVIVITLILVAVVVTGVTFYMKSRVAAAVAMERANQALEERDELRGQVAASMQAVERVEEALARSREEAIERERQFREELARIETAPPTQLVDQGSQILGVNDITTDGNIVYMPVETYRQIVFRLVEHQEYVNVREPRWEVDRANYQLEIRELKTANGNLQKQITIGDGVIQDLRTVISKQKNVSFWTKLLWAGIGYAAGSLK